MPDMHSAQLIDLENLAVLALRGADVARFLQGQLSVDLERLTPDRSLLGGFHNPQGRTIALLHLLRLDEQTVLALVPRDLAAPVVSRLSRYVLRAKVRIAAEFDEWRVSGLTASLTVAASSALTESAAVTALPEAHHAQILVGGAVLTSVGRSALRWLMVRPAGRPAPQLGFELQRADDAIDAWTRLEIADGLPQIYPGTSEQFVAQMLNLDAIGAIDFDKGCYTGQEIIARAHYRGRVKRRMQRFVSRAPRLLMPGEAGILEDGRAFKVIRAARLEDGRCDFLAVAALPGAEPEGGGSTAPQGTESEGGDSAARQGAQPEGARVAAEIPAAITLADPVSLPYALPE